MVELSFVIVLSLLNGGVVAGLHLTLAVFWSAFGHGVSIQQKLLNG